MRIKSALDNPAAAAFASSAAASLLFIAIFILMLRGQPGTVALRPLLGLGTPRGCPAPGRAPPRRCLDCADCFIFFTYGGLFLVLQVKNHYCRYINARPRVCVYLGGFSFFCKMYNSLILKKLRKIVIFRQIMLFFAQKSLRLCLFFLAGLPAKSAR